MTLILNIRLRPSHFLQKKIVVFFLICTPFVLSAQQWTIPVNISNLDEYYTLKSDFTIDNEGIIHCAWNVKYGNVFGKIFYSKSEDDGETWSEAEDASQNDENYCTGPHIAHDSENNIYITYDFYDYTKDRMGTSIYFTKKDSTGWSDPVSISEGINNKIVVDYNDRLYVFWYMRSPEDGEFYYQYLEEGEWSEIICPYFANWKIYINSMVPDRENNLHCSGFYSNVDSGLYDDHTVYFRYDHANDQWSDEFVDFSVDHSTYNDISLDTNQQPHICWGEELDSDATDLVTYYSGYNGNDWSEKLILAEGKTKRQRILVDSLDRKHITVVQAEGQGNKLLYYSQPNGSDWESLQVDQCDNAIFTPEIHFNNDKLYTVYTKSDDPSLGNLFISKLELLTTIGEDNISPEDNSISIKTYPNPFHDKTNIYFTLNKTGYVRFDIFNMEGEKITTLAEEYFIKGKHEIIWDGKDQNGKEVKPGLYLVRLRSGRNILTRSVEKI